MPGQPGSEQTVSATEQEAAMQTNPPGQQHSLRWRQPMKGKKKGEVLVGTGAVF